MCHVFHSLLEDAASLCFAARQMARKADGQLTVFGVSFLFVGRIYKKAFHVYSVASF
jgi:hypothetical protein